MKRILVGFFIILKIGHAYADEILVAVAANFAAPMDEIARAFSKSSGHQLKISTGSSGKLYAQIRNGAPFQIFLSADQDKPAQLENEGLSVQGSRFTYATGKLVLWSANPDTVDTKGKVLEANQFRRIALANPKAAPYGEAAMETLTALNLKSRLASKFVLGENISQTYQFVESGNAEIGFVALSQISERNRLTSGSMWLVPEKLYAPIRQDTVLLVNGKNSTPARQLLIYLKSETAQRIIKSYGYDVQ